MKKTYLDFTQIRVVRHLPKMVSRRNPGLEHRGLSHGAQYKTDGGADDSEDKRTEEELLTKIQGKIDKALETRATKDELAAIKASQIGRAHV